MQREDLDEPELTRLATALGAELRPGDVLRLVGPMGAGKTTFVRALARGLGVHAPDRVCSPTFNICMIHPGSTPLVHVDLYRMSEVGAAGAESAAFEALGLGRIEELVEPGGMAGPAGGVLAVEWADLCDLDVPHALDVRLERNRGSDRRTLAVVGHGARGRQIARRWSTHWAP